jgi:AcrR family transcriptional regulator
MQQVAREAGVSIGLVYHHFADRADLLAACFSYINERVESYTLAGPLPSTALEALEAAVLGEIQDRPEVREGSAAWGELRAASVFEPALRPALAEATATWSADVAERIRAAQDAGEVPAEVDAGEAAALLTALVEGVSTRWLNDSLDVEQAHALLRAALRDVLRTA